MPHRCLVRRLHIQTVVRAGHWKASLILALSDLAQTVITTEMLNFGHDDRVVAPSTSSDVSPTRSVEPPVVERSPAAAVAQGNTNPDTVTASDPAMGGTTSPETQK